VQWGKKNGEDDAPENGSVKLPQDRTERDGDEGEQQQKGFVLEVLMRHVVGFAMGYPECTRGVDLRGFLRCAAMVWIHFLGVGFGSVAQWRPYQGPSPATVASANRFSRVAEGFSTS